MMRVVRFMLGTIIRLKVVILSVLAGAGIAYGLRVRQESHSWGLDAADQDRELPGDDLVATPDHVETRSLGIEALPATVWPLLTKLGYGRAGWYSYSMLDRAWMVMGAAPGDGAAADRSATEIRAVGDVVPTHPDGGLVAKVVEPDRALVLYLDDALLREQVAEQAAEGSKSARKALDQMDEMPTFGLSWAFVLEPEPGGRTRLVERVRLQMDVSGGQKRALPLMGLGLFAFVRQQMLGIKRRVEAGEG